MVLFCDWVCRGETIERDDVGRADFGRLFEDEDENEEDEEDEEDEEEFGNRWMISTRQRDCLNFSRSRKLPAVNSKTR